jgi:hypothetical protein
VQRRRLEYASPDTLPKIAAAAAPDRYLAA